MATFVKAPAVDTSAEIGVSFNNDFFYHSGGTTQTSLSSITMSGITDHELVWFGLAIGGNIPAITTTQFEMQMDNTGMEEAFSPLAQGVDWDFLLSKSQTNNNVPATDSRLGAIVETEYFTFNNVTATTLSEAYKEVWTDGKLANDPTDPNYNAYNHSNTLNFATSSMGTGGHIYDDDATNVLFVAFWGPGRYVKEAAKRIKFRPVTNNDKEWILQACIRTETVDTAYSDIAKLRRSDVNYDINTNATFFYNQGEDTAWTSGTGIRDTDTKMIDTLTYPHTSLVQLSYPRGISLEDKDDDTKFSFIYEGKKVKFVHIFPAAGEVVDALNFTNNTASIAYDFISNKRYGMGEQIADISQTSTAVNEEQTNYLRYMLREYGDRCEQILTFKDSEGVNTTQNRYTFNSVLEQVSNKFETIQKILNNMNAQYYFHNGYFKIYQDSDQSEPVKIVNQSNCRDIKFTGRNHLPEVNTFYVKYNNERKMFKQDTAFAELRDQLNTGMPVVSKEVVMQGITNTQQAERHARYLAESSKTEKEFVEYVAGADHCYVKPGDLINLTHTEDDSKKHSGRILSISGNVATIDGTVELDTTKTYNIYIDNGVNTTDNTFTPFNQTIADNKVFETIATVSSTSTNQLILGSTTGLQSINQDNGSLTAFNRQLFNLVEPDASPTKPYQQEKIYRIQSITEVQPFEYQIVAQRYDVDKWTDIDAGYKFGVDISKSNWSSSYTESN